MKSDSARTESLGLQEFQTRNIEVLEDPLSSSKDERVQDEAELVDKTVLQHRLRQLAHALRREPWVAAPSHPRRDAVGLTRA